MIFWYRWELSNNLSAFVCATVHDFVTNARLMVLYSWICPALCHTAIQEEDPADPTGDPTYTEHTWGDENIRSPTTRQVARHHIRLETLIQTTRTHLASRRAAAAGCLRMLANTKGGLSHRNMKILYNAYVFPALSYAAPVWWNGKKQQIRKIETIQNRCLRTILLVFNTTPLHAMQMESGIPPLQIRLNHMKQRAAARLAVRIDPTNPIYERLPIQLRRGTNRRTAPTPTTPHETDEKETGHAQQV